MSTNIELIDSKIVGSGGSSSITFTSIPNTYTDLQLLCSLRNAGAGNQEFVKISFNGSTSGYTLRTAQADGNATSSTTYSQPWFGFAVGVDATSNTFSNTQIYIPNYTSSNNKSISVDCVPENNIRSNQMIMSANLWSDTSAITSITLTMQNGANFVENSTAYLYGISNVTSTTKATGGIVSSDGTYNYHMFPFSGTFTPTTAISADVLVIAGGGSGGGSSSSGNSGGGGAGGLVYSASQSLTATGYSVTVGAGGAATTTNQNNGSNSVFGSITATGGGGGGQGAAGAGIAGGSAGGNAAFSTAGATAASPAGQGNAGGTAFNTPDYSSGGGGGAGAAGGNGTTTTGGAGGNGLNTYSSWAIATQTGANNGYYAAGGGGGTNGIAGPGGLGGGGRGAVNAATAPTNGLANTGSGGGGAGNASTPTSGAGGSGLVIIRYAI